MTAICNLPSRVRDHEVHVTRSKLKNGKYTLYGRLHRKCDQAAVGKRIEHQYDPDKVGLDTAVQMLTQRVDNAFETFQHSSVVKTEKPAVAQIGIFSKAFAAYQEEGNPNPKWCASTSRITHRFFERNILPTLDALGNTATQADMAELMESLVEKASKSSRSRRDRRIAERSVSGYLQRINWILDQMHQCDPSIVLLQFDLNTSSTVSYPEQAKYIPDDVRVAFASKLVSLSSLPPEEYCLVPGVAAMFLMGLRPAEACAVQMGALTIRDDWYVDCPVIAQIRNGNRTDLLKTEAAYRHAIGGYLMAYFVKQRREQLYAQMGESYDISELYLVSSQDDPRQFANPSALSACAKRLLLECGFLEAYLQSAASLMNSEPLPGGFGGKERDVVAYILRRDWIGRAQNCCGMSSANVDYLVGHANLKSAAVDYTNPDVQLMLARQLERHVILPKYSRHPCFSPVMAKPGRTKKLLLEGYNGYRICAEDGPLEIGYTYTTEESGEWIWIETNNMLLSSIQSESGRMDSPQKCKGRLPVGKTHPLAYYQEIIERARQIDLAKFNEKEEK